MSGINECVCFMVKQAQALFGTEAKEREWAEGTVSSLPGTLNIRIKFCHSTEIARSGGAVRASTTSYA